MDIFKIVQTFASLTQESVLNTLSLSRSFRQCYIENTEMLPVSINPLVDAHFNQRLRETAHSRIRGHKTKRIFKREPENGGRT